MGKIITPFGPPEWDEKKHNDAVIEFQKQVATVVNSLGYDALWGIPDFVLAQCLRMYLYQLPPMFASLAQMMRVDKK